MPDGIALMEKAVSFEAAKLIKDMGIYPFFREISSPQGPVVRLGGNILVMPFLPRSYHPSRGKKGIH